MMYPQDLIDSLLKSVDIVDVISSYIPVEKKGRSFMAVCPFHDDKNPSLNISREKQIFKCFVCGTGGNAISFVSKYEKIPFAEAVRVLAKRVGFHDSRLDKEEAKPKIDEETSRLYACINDLDTLYRYSLSIPEAEKAREYLTSRNLLEDTIKKYGIGYSPLDGSTTVKFLQAKGHSLKSIEGIGIALAKSQGTSDNNAGRIIFPLRAPDGQVVGFSARRIENDGSSKYINTPETRIFHKGSVLYNYHNVIASAHRDGYCYVLEGFMDVMALEKAGLPNAVALMGTALTQDQIHLLKRLRCEIRLCLDGDNPGQTAMMKCLSLLAKAKINVRVVDYDKDLRDPDDILQQDGPDALKEKMEKLISPMDFQLSFYRNTKKLESKEDKQKVLKAFLPYLRSIAPGIEQEDYLVKLSDATGYQVEAIRSLLKQGGDDVAEEEEIIYDDFVSLANPHPEKIYLTKLEQAERSFLYCMLQNRDAVEYFQKNIISFHTSVYQEIANYLIDYASSHPGEIALNSVLAAIEANEENESDRLVNTLSNLALDPGFLPYSDSLMKRYGKEINQEKDFISEKLSIEKEVREANDQNDAAKKIDEYISMMNQRRKK